MAYTQPGIDAAGIHVPEYADIRDLLLERFRQIFGDDLYLGEDTQDYQMIAEFADCLDDVYSLIIETYNARNPDYASGTALDMAISLNGLRRITATYSTVTLKLGGIAGAVVPAGSLVQDTANYQWATSADAVIGENGDAEVSAVCTVPGAVSAPAGSIGQIMSPTYGWVSVTNEADAHAGQDTESDAQLRTRRVKSVANTGVSIAESIYGTVRALSGVTKERLYQNNGSTTDANGIPGHSICMCVLGGDNQAIAEAIFNKKAPGVGTYGSTSVQVTDVFLNTNTISFTRPAALRLEVEITMKTFAGYNDATIPAIKQNIIDFVNGLNIGDDLNVGLLWAPILALNADPTNPVCSPVTVTVNGQSALVSLAYNQYASVVADDIEITVE